MIDNIEHKMLHKLLSFMKGSRLPEIHAIDWPWTALAGSPAAFPNYESWVVPAGVPSALADILGAEFGPIIDFVLERGGAKGVEIHGGAPGSASFHHHHHHHHQHHHQHQNQLHLAGR